MKRKQKLARALTLKQTMRIDSLPDCILLRVLSFFSQDELCTFALVSKHWRCVAFDGSLWRNVQLPRLKSHNIDSLFGTRLGRQLKKLVFWKCSISPENLVALSKSCSQIHELCLRRNTIKQQKVQRLRKPCFPELLVLDARDLQGYVGHALQLIAHAPKIEKVALDASMEGFFDPNVFRNTPNLQVLDCSRCMDVRDEGVAAIAMSCPKLKSLSLMRCYNFEGTALPSLFHFCPMLKSLSVSYTHVTNSAVEDCELENSGLLELDMSHCPGISSSGVYSVISRLPDMVYLNVNSCSYGPGIDQRIFSTLARYTSLEVLDLDATDGSNGVDDDLITITKRCANLKVLRVNKGFATVTGLKQCLQNLPNLRRFGIVNYRPTYQDHGMEVEHVLNSLAEFNPKLEILELSDFSDKETRTKTDAFVKVMTCCKKLQKISIFTFNRDMFVMAAEGRLKADRKDIRLVQPTMMCPTPRVVTTLPRLCFDRLVYGDEMLNDDDPWIARKYY